MREGGRREGGREGEREEGGKAREKRDKCVQNLLFKLKK